MGLGAMTKSAYSFEWLVSSVPTQYKTDATTYINCTDAVTMAVFCTYIGFIKKDWEGICLLFLALNYLAFLLGLLVCPESPKWLLNQGRRK